MKVKELIAALNLLAAQGKEDYEVKFDSYGDLFDVTLDNSAGHAVYVDDKDKIIVI